MKLRDYQEENSNKAVEILKQHKIVYLSMEVRTGKTLTSLATSSKYGVKKVLFVTKKKAISSILDDYKKFGFNFELEVINFESLFKVKSTPDLVIVDEAHSIGAFPKPSKRTEALKKIVGDKPLILLSGTPTPESYSQMYHQLWISKYSPFKEKTFYKWAKNYVFVKQRIINGYQVNDYSATDTGKIWNKIKHLMISFSQKDAGFEVFIDEKIHMLKVPGTVKSIYDILERDRIVYLDEHTPVSASTPAILMQKLHQLSSGTILSDDGDRFIIDDFKATYIKKTFKGKHIAIFYKFIAEREMLKKYFDNIVDTPEEFNSDLSSIFIGQYQSTREGINLSTADALVMINIDFSAVSYFQAKARLQTKERTESAELHWIFGEGLLTDYVYQAVSDKKDFTLKYYIQCSY